VKALVARIGLYRVAAVLVGGALVLEILRVEVLPQTQTVAVACTLGEVCFIAAAAALIVIARRPRKGQ
jgi:hypothetical protein